MAEAAKTAVYLCAGCGIGEAVSIEALEAVATGESKASSCRRHDHLCDDAGVATIQADIDSGAAERIVIAACSERVNADRFRFDGTPPIRCDLRERVAWSQPPGAEDTQMLAADYVRMALAEAEKSAPPSGQADPGTSKTILVVGGGVSGLTAALESARAGYQVMLVERASDLGGHGAKWSKRMPHRPPYRLPQDNDIGALIAAVTAEPRITVHTRSRVVSTAGGPGRFLVTLDSGGTTIEETLGAIVVATGWRPYDATKLGHLGYGASPDVVTGVELETMLGAGELACKSDGRRPAAVAFIQCAGSRDPDHLPYCSSICCGVSIKQALMIRERVPDSSVYIIHDELRTPGTAEAFYRAAQAAGVIFMKGKVSAVGADLTVTVEDVLLGETVAMAGLDLVVLATGMMPNATAPEAEAIAPQPAPDIDPLAPILAAGATVPEPGSEDASEDDSGPEIGSILNLQYRQGPHLPILADGFADSHFLCFPYETRRSGIYTCGPVRRPMDMAESATDATGAALKAIQAIEAAAAGTALHPRGGDLSFPRINLDPCTKCRRCTVECPFGAIDESDDDYPVVEVARCRRCGTCMGACPVRTISFENYSVEMVSAMIKAVEVPDEFAEKPRVLVLACRNDAIPALDMAGISGTRYSPFARVVPVRCLGSVSALWISDALSTGYDGVILMGCKAGDDYQCHFVKGSAITQERMGKIAETLKSMMLEEERVVTHEVAIADARRAPELIDSFLDTIAEIGPNPFKGF
ncbi:MAG: FAD-dependent oxidoreductase [Alphaproteobacteria bacterium]|jgi:quinone-modifying oxidoreductase subunit QmoB|nr:FAD-dependent oxidoreductase [Alphaproteobacteria bacterium]MDP6515746.1 FAD-dependent oxidoreductase [Alphaproteobacteria bacterium]